MPLRLPLAPLHLLLPLLLLLPLPPLVLLLLLFSATAADEQEDRNGQRYCMDILVGEASSILLRGAPLCPLCQRFHASTSAVAGSVVGGGSVIGLMVLGAASPACLVLIRAYPTFPKPTSDNSLSPKNPNLKSLKPKTLNLGRALVLRFP